MVENEIQRLEAKAKREHLELTLLRDIRAVGLPEPVRQYQFCERGWKMDFSWSLAPGKWLDVEVQGGTWSDGAHVRGGGYEKDCIKHNRATVMGRHVLRFTGVMVEDGRAIGVIEKALEALK